jgi:tetratricopeptide (TPR) repeat protein
MSDAGKDLKDALAAWPSGKRHLEILRLLAEERFAAAGGPEGDLAFDEGVAFLSRAIAEHRDDKAAPEVQKSLAMAYDTRGRHQKAAGEWRGLVERFPTHADAPQWRTALAESLHAAGQFDVAITEWKAFLSAYPNDPQWQAVQARIVSARFEKGQAVQDLGDVDGAIAAWKGFAEEFPTDGRSALALTEAGLLLAGRKDFDGAITLWRGVVGRYAGDGQAPRAWLLVAKTLEDDLARLEDAVKEYEALVAKHAGTPFGQEAAGRLARLRGKHLEVRGERVIGAGESAVLRVASRNMPTLKVKVFKLSLEEYFRRKHTVAGVENVQVEIVKPDLTTEWKLDPYAPFALATADRLVPTAGPGAYVVVVSDDDLTSTTLLVVSDVEAIVKAAAGRQVFVWARNRATGQPEAGARVLLSTGSELFVEGVTGKDGVYVYQGDKPARRVLVLSGAHAAASEWEPGQTYAEGWQTKVHVSTDRPVYRPGQTVKWRGIFRRANGGGYTVPNGVEAQAVLIDARGAEAARTKVTCSDVGLFDGEFALDGEAPLGDWTVRIDVDNLTFTGPFRVLEFKKPEFSLEVVPGKPSYPTGEEVKATIRLRYGFGGPVVGSPVRWQVTRVPHDFAPSAVNDYSWYFQDADALQRARDAARTAPQGVLVAQGQATTDEKGEATIERRKIRVP